jgi:putative membrane protein
MWEMHEGWGWWMLWGWLWMVLFWGAIVVLVVWAVQKLSGHSHNTGARSPLDVARERYARGEIGKEEFDQIRRDLSSTSGETIPDPGGVGRRRG